LSLSLSKGRGFGIAEALLRQLQGRVDGADATKTATNADATPRAEHALDAVQRVQSLVQSVAATNADNPRLTAAIQDAMRTLFGTANEDDAAPDKSAALDGTPANFVESLRPMAQRIAAKLGIDSAVLLSQSALETGWGQKVIQCADGSSSFNFFNIKADANWTGAVVKVPTIEYQSGVAVREWASFRAYASPEESFADYARLIGENPRYQQALECGNDPRAYVKALAEAGYATDPRYAQKVLAVYDSEPMQAATN
jgi:peptidoglycan hydrolase FlgJ